MQESVKRIKIHEDTDKSYHRLVPWINLLHKQKAQRAEVDNKRNT